MRPRSSKSRWKSSTNGSAAESAPPCFAHQRLTTRPFYCVWKPAFGWARSAPCAGRMSILPAACCIFDAQPIESTTAGAPELVTQTPKTDNSLQTIPLTAKMLSILRSFRAGENDYLFTGSDKPMEPRTLQYRFQKFLKELGISSRNFHILRHSFATRCIDCGMDIKSLSEILGHANVQVTLQMYVHPSMVPSAVRWRRQASCPAFLSGRSKAVP